MLGMSEKLWRGHESMKGHGCNMLKKAVEMSLHHDLPDVFTFFTMAVDVDSPVTWLSLHGC
jgi:hypothetical protein